MCNKLSCCFLVLLSFTFVPCVHGDLVAGWHFDESSGSVAEDFVGNVDGTLVGDAAFVSGGISGNAVSMSIAGGGLVNMGDNFGFTSGDFSVVAWVLLEDGDTTDNYILAGKHRSTFVAGYFLGANGNFGYGQDNKAFFYDSNPSPGDEPISTTTINDGAWHQVVGVYHDGGNAEIYVDGGGVEDFKTSDDIASTTASFLIGGISNSSGTPTSFLNGTIDEVQLYDHALSSAEVQLLYAAVPETTAFMFGALISTLFGCGVCVKRKLAHACTN